MKRVKVKSSRVKDRYSERSGTVQESFVKNRIKFVRILWDGEVEIDEREYTSKSVVNITLKKKTEYEWVPVVSLAQSLAQNEVHEDIERDVDLSDVSRELAQHKLNQTSNSVRKIILEDDSKVCTREVLHAKLNKAIALLKELVTFYNSAIESANRNGDIVQGAKLKAELLEFQKSDGYIAAVQLGDESLIESSSALVDVITEQVIAQQIKIRLCKKHAKKKAVISSNLSDIDLLNNQNLLSKSKVAFSLAPGTAGLDDDNSDVDIPFDADDPDTFPINVDARLYEVSTSNCYYNICIIIYV
jgi:ribosomal protein S8